jgi:RNA polymerase sigma-70 factor, ECF subfamily
MSSQPYFGVSATRYSMFARLIPTLQNSTDQQENEFWEEFIDKYTPLIYGVCRRNNLQNADAEDITQDVILKVISKLKSGEFTYDSRHRFRAWLATVTSNLIIDGFRKARKARKDHVDYLETIQEDSLARSAQQAVDYEYFLGQALEKLEKNSTPWNWKVFSVRVLGLKSAKEAGEELGTTPGNVDTICCRMKIMLKGVWSELILESNEGGVDAGHLANKLYLEP